MCRHCKLDKALKYAHGLCWFCYWNRLARLPG